MSEPIDVFWSFRSPYSYLATPGLLALMEDFDIDLRFRPVLPLAVRQPGFFSPERLRWARYLATDWTRQARMKGMVHEWPSPDPIVQDFATLTVAEDQPYIHRITRLGVEAQKRGRGPHFAYEVSHLIFGGTKDWHLGSHLTDAAARAGLDLAEMEAAIDPDGHDAIIAKNQDDLEAAGHWGVPTCVLRGEPYFGEDRLPTLRWQLTELGLAN